MSGSYSSVEAEVEYEMAGMTVQRFPKGYDGKEIEDIRELYRDSVIEKGYEGFDGEYDRHFDEQAIYFRVLEDDSIVGTARIVEKEEGNSLPLEQAEIKDVGGHLEITNDGTIGEFTSFWFDSGKSFKALITGMVDFAYPRYDRLYATYDPDIDIRQLYDSILNLNEPNPDLRIVHDGYTRNGETVEWGIMKIEEDGLKEVAESERFTPDQLTRAA